MSKKEEIKNAATLVKQLEDTQSVLSEIGKSKNVVKLVMSKTDGPDFERSIHILSHLGFEVKQSVLDALRSYEKYLNDQIDNVSI